MFNYEKIINYFNKKYPDKILSVNLENLTFNPEQYTKKIFEFCNLDWNEKVLKFYDNEKVISKSSSFLQIRSEIKKYEKSKYQSYYFLIKDKLI